MAYSVDKIHSSEKVVEGKFTASTGSVNPYTRGLIFENDEIVSSSFGFSPSYTPTLEQIADLCAFNTDITTCFEGPLVKLWWDSDQVHHLSTTNKLDCTNSYWGNKDERFGDLFYKNGGEKFLNECQQRQLTHHFMIMTPSLMVTSDIDLKDNDCMVVYLGSMSKKGYYSNIERNEQIFYYQSFNTIPTKDVLNGKILYPYAWKTDDVNYYFNFIQQILKHGYNGSQHAMEPLSQDEKFIGVDSSVISSYFGSPVIMRTPQGIVKFVPESYEKKCNIIGNSPNIKLLVYKLMDACRTKQDAVLEYFEKYDFLFVPDWEFLDSLKESDNVKISIIQKYRSLGTVGFMDAKNPRNSDARERNMMLILLLCLPQCKANEAIDAYKNYIECQTKLKDFISINLTKIVEGKYDETIENEKVIARLKDMCVRSFEYAKKNNKNTEGYNKRLQFSLKGLINNEHGASLYKINKAISKFI